MLGSTLKPISPHQQPKRHLNIHEYCSLGLLKNAGVPVPVGAVASTADEAYEIAKNLCEYIRYDLLNTQNLH